MMFTVIWKHLALDALADIYVSMDPPVNRNWQTPWTF